MFSKEEDYIIKQDELFDEWRQEELHKGKVFNRDGIVNPYKWFESERRVMFLLKEAYHGATYEYNEYDLAEDLYKNGPWDKDNIWNRVAEWANGLIKCEKDYLPPYRGLSKEKANKIIQKIAVVNIKKSDGKPNSEWEEIEKYADDDKEKLYKQIELIDPTIIVCGFTFGALKKVISESEIKHAVEEKKNGIFTWGNRVIIDYYHPANHFPIVLNYYGLIGIYMDFLNQN